VAAGVVRGRAEKQAAVFASCADQHHNGVAFGLGDFIHPPAAKQFIQFSGGKACRQAVHWHRLKLAGFPIALQTSFGYRELVNMVFI
jgi:hypothetical protein